MNRCYFLFNLLLSLLISAAAYAQPGIKKSFKFSFGTAAAKKGYTLVQPGTLYSEEKGYGFLRGAVLHSALNTDAGSSADDFITSDSPFFFTLDLPEGNYNVTLTLGDKNGTSSQTVRAECRRLMLEQVETADGKVVKKEFTVNIRTPEIGSTGEKVKLKPRELNYRHWDKQLTLEFNGKAPKIRTIEISPAKNPVTIFLAGNSTVVDQADEPYAAWGQMLPSFFVPEKVVVANYAESGEALSSFKSARRLDKILSVMQRGDYLFIEFGHNDQKQKGEGVGAYTTYKRDLKYYIAEARKKGGIPVLVTSMNRRNFDENGKIVNTLGDYPDAVRQTAREENVALIDLNNMSKILYEAWGVEPSLKAFVHYPANTFPGQSQALADNTHFTPYGAYEIARCIVNGIKQNKLALSSYLRKDLPAFDPSRPDPISNFNWPLSPSSASVKPDGN